MFSNRMAGGLSGLRLVDHLGDGAHLEIPVDAGDALQLADPLDPRDPVAQIGMRLGELADADGIGLVPRSSMGASGLPLYGAHGTRGQVRRH